MTETFITALDIGSHSLKMALCEHDTEGNLHLISLKERPAAGIKKGAVINMEKAVEAISLLREEVTEETGLLPDACYVAYSGENIESLNSDGVTAIDLRGKGRTISETDKQNVIKQAQAVPVGDDKEIAHIIPLQYMVDNQELVKDPVNVIGVRLKAVAHIIIANASLLDNITLAVKRAGLTPNELVYSPLAAGQALLSSNEREKGTLFIEIGAASTKISFYQYGAPYFDAVMPIGGATLTGDLAYMLKISAELAETIKIKHGCCYKPLLEREDYAYIPGNADRSPESVSEHYICDILAARMTDIYTVAYRILSVKGWLERVDALVIGGGGGEMPGSAELAGRIFGRPARTGYVTGFENLKEDERSSIYGAVCGLLKREEFLTWNEEYEKKEFLRQHNVLAKESRDKEQRSFNFIRWIKDFF
jgi:cell division protein FtsA